MTNNIDSHQAILETKAKYCRFMDTKQWQRWSELFTADIHMDVSEDVTSDIGSPITAGIDACVAQVSTMVGAATTVHQVHSPEIEFTSNTCANVIWAMSDIVVWPEDVEPPLTSIRSIHGYGHYHETYKLTGTEWKIASLKLTRLYRAINQ